MKKIITTLMMLIISATTLADNTSLHGSRATFLFGGEESWFDKTTSLSYLAPGMTAEDRRIARQLMLDNGDTHAYLYTRHSSTLLKAGALDQKLWPTFKPKLQELRRAGLKPILWLTPESRHKMHRQPIQAQKAYMQHIVKEFDNEAEGYVICLECDEYWTADTVTDLVNHVKKFTNKPVGVHLTGGVGGHTRDLRFYRNVDYIYLQSSHHWKTADYERAIKDVEEAIKLGIPVIASEYSTSGGSEEAKRLGDLLCRAGAVGTGTGRNVVKCGQLPAQVQDKPKKKNNSNSVTDYVIVAGLFYGIVYYLDTYTNVFRKLNFTHDINNDRAKLNFSGDVWSNNRHNLTLDISHESVIESQTKQENNKLMLNYNYRW